MLAQNRIGMMIKHWEVGTELKLQFLQACHTEIVCEPYLLPLLL